MINKTSTLYSVVRQKCPRCHEGNMFVNPTYSTRFMTMHKSCSHCGLDFIQEPSFYFGAMYFSYAIQVIVFIVVYIALRYTINPETWTYVEWMIAGALLILPLNFRLSRVMWINLFISFSDKPKTLNENI